MDLPDFKGVYLKLDTSFKEIKDDSELHDICYQSLNNMREVHVYLCHEGLEDGVNEGAEVDDDGVGEGDNGVTEGDEFVGEASGEDDDDVLLGGELHESDFDMLSEEENDIGGDKNKVGEKTKERENTNVEADEVENVEQDGDTEKSRIFNDSDSGEEDINLTGDELDITKGSDDEDVEGGKCPVFRPTEILNPVFKLGLRFSTKTQLREAIRSHAILSKRNITITSNDRMRVCAKCDDKDCGWKLHAYKVKDECTFQIRTYVPDHTCGASFNVKNMKSKWLADKYLRKFKTDPKRNVSGFRQDAMDETQCHISEDQAYRAKRRAIRMIEGTPDDQFKLKGLIKAFEEVLPKSDHRFCVRHLLGNLTRRGFRGLAFQNALWKAARATIENEFSKRFSELTNLDDDVAEWFSDKSPKHWCKGFFNIYPKCDMLLNNCCETFNGNILPAREMPILSMLEWIMEYLMKRLQVNRDRAKSAIKWKGYLCPKIKTIIDKNIGKMGGCVPIKSDDMHYQVRCLDDDGEQFTVDLEKMTCGCRRSELSGIPCKHACSAIQCQGLRILDFVDKCYTVDTYKKVYAPPIMPINSRNEWKKSDFTPPLPPNDERSSGRPCIARRMEVDEVQLKQKKRSRGKPKLVNNPFKLKRQQKTCICSKCGGEGHNQTNKKCPMFRPAENPSEDSFSHVSIEMGSTSNVYGGPSKSATVKAKLKLDEDDTSLTPQFPPYLDPYYLDHTAAIPSNQATSSGVPRATRKSAKSAAPIPPNAATSKVQSSKVTRKPPMMPRKVTPMPTRIFSSPGPSMYSQLQQGQAKNQGVKIREPPLFSTRQVVHSVPGYRVNEDYRGAITVQEGKKFVSLSNLASIVNKPKEGLGNKDKGKKKL
ncbi:hypothetical protein BUALT_Bualt01G0157400 [Buddleja alternifolia]|uniref:SWIM-type domain-containing protein n=1 Tax=Buddleja alternifolia TaxID=168488 RepID=A0AAV6YBM1_9LAMI|nr:hypothetical protein BUALT_Bualt01G0157400 [Buddleja alternifolia]